MQKKLLFLIEADLTTGASKCGFELIKHLTKNTNYTPIVVTQHKFDVNEECTKIGVENYHLHYARICSLGGGILGRCIAIISRPFLNYISLKRLKKKINFEKIAFVHSNGSSIDFGAYIHKKYGIPHIWHIRDFFLFDGIWKPLTKNYPKYLEEHSTVAVTVSKAIQNYLTNHGCNADHIQTIYDGIEISNTTITKKRQSIHKDILKVVCVGQICKLKGQETLIDAISLLPSAIQQHFKFDFFGNFTDDVHKNILEKIDHAKIQNIIEFKGYSKNINQDIRSYDLGIQPSHSEGFSRVTAEYMFAGLCIIAANEGAIPELIQHKENGFLYEDYNAQELANILTYCYENQNLMHLLAQKAQDKALSNYTLHHNFEKITALYNKISNSET